MNIKQKRLASLGLTCISTAGVVGTFIFATKEAPAAKEKLDSIPKENRKERFLTFLKSYKKSLIFAGATIATGISSRILSAKTEASLIATVSMLDASLHKYKNKVKEVFGIEGDKSVLKSIMKDEYKKPEIDANDGECLFYDDILGYFYAKPEKIYKVINDVNADMYGNTSYQFASLNLPGYFTLGEFVKLTGARLLNKNLPDDALNVGWSWDYLSEMWELCFIHLQIEEPDENGARLLYWFETPVWNPEEWYDYVHNNLGAEYWLHCPKCINKDLSIYDIEN